LRIGESATPTGNATTSAGATSGNVEVAMQDFGALSGASIYVWDPDGVPAGARGFVYNDGANLTISISNATFALNFVSTGGANNYLGFSMDGAGDVTYEHGSPRAPDVVDLVIDNAAVPSLITLVGPAGGGGANEVTIRNYSGSALSLYDETAGAWVNNAFGLNGNAPLTAVSSNFQLDGTHTYSLRQYLGAGGGHTFTVTAGVITDPAMTPGLPNRYYQISGSTITVRGVPVTFHMVTAASGAPDYEVFLLNTGGNNGSGTAYLGGADYQAQLIPDDNMTYNFYGVEYDGFDGVYENIQFSTSGSSSGTLTLGANFDIINWSASGQSFVRTGPRSIQVITDLEAVYDITAGPVFFEAESMTAINPAGTWGVVPHQPYFYHNYPSRGNFLSGNFNQYGGVAGQGEAGKTISVRQAGTHRVWVCYEYYGAFRGPFNVAVYQNSVLKGSQDFDDAVNQALTLNQITWGYFDVALEQGDADIVFNKVLDGAGYYDTASITRLIDCVVLSYDPAYVPDIMDFADPLYLKVEMESLHTTPCVMRSTGTFQKPKLLPGEVFQGRIQHGNIWEDGHHPGEYTTSLLYNPGNPFFLEAYEESPWMNIVPMLSYEPNNHLEYHVISEYDMGLPASSFSLHYSTTPSDVDVFKVVDRLPDGLAEAAGAGVYVNINLLTGSILSDFDYSQSAFDTVSALAAMPGNRPTNFPVATGNNVLASFSHPLVNANEMGTLEGLGFNSKAKEYDALWYANGFTKLFINNKSMWSQKFNGDLSTPDTAAMTANIDTAADGAIATGKTGDVFMWVFMDEPGSMTLDHIVSDLDCQAKFRTYLAGLELTPATFGESMWEDVFPTVNKLQPMLYYYTVMFRTQIVTDFFKLGNDTLALKIPNMPTTANFAEDATYYGNAISRGVDWFAIFKQGALNLGWSEDWLAQTVTKQLCGYRSAMLRSATHRANKQFGMYNVLWNTPWDIEAKAATHIGHGAQGIYHYAWGPEYTGGDALSDYTDMYPALKRVNFAIGAAENFRGDNYLVGATVPAAKIALLYSHTTDAWTLDQGTSVFGKDRAGIYLILRHLGYPVDILTEQDIVDGYLAGYSMVIYDGSHLLSNALIPLVNWVSAGGILYVGPGALGFDEFNNSLGFDALMGITRQAYQLVAEPGDDMSLRFAIDRKPVTYNGSPMESLCGYQKVTSTGGATILATFDEDGSPAAFTKTVGVGKLEFSGFFPGLAYQKGGAATKYDRDVLEPEQVTYGSTDWPVVCRNLFANDLVGSLTPPVTTGNHLLEANRIEAANGKGSVVILSNWTGVSLPSARISFPRNGMLGAPAAVEGTIISWWEIGDIITVQMNIDGAFDFIIIPSPLGDPGDPPPTDVTLESEDFESGLGDWFNASGDTDNWTRDAGGTPSDNTGPDHDNTGGGSNGYYMFMETSSPEASNAGDNAILEGPNLDARTYDIMLKFYYHMYGATMGTLNVDVYDGSWNNAVWSISGQKHGSSGAAFTLAQVDLSAYSGTVKIRFRGVAAGGWQGDMAIDDIEIIGTQYGPNTNLFNSPVAFTDVLVADVTGMEFDSTIGCTYRLDVSDDLSVTNFQPTGAILEGSGETLIFFDPTGPSSGKVYRINATGQ